MVWQLIALAGVGLVMFALLTFLRRWADSFVMIAFAIGCVVNANIWNASNVPVIVGNLVFAIDSILYTMFLHTVAVKFLHYPMKDAKLFVYSSIVAIIISAFIEFFANVFSQPWDIKYLLALAMYFASAIGSVLGIFLMVVFFKACKKRGIHNGFAVPMGILIASVVNSTIYYGCYCLIYQTFIDNFIGILLGSYIGKTYSIILGIISYKINGRLWMPNELKQKDETL